MDNTLNSYNKLAPQYAEKHGAQIPARLYELAKVFLIQNGSTLDLGCGIGTDGR